MKAVGSLCTISGKTYKRLSCPSVHAGDFRRGRMRDRE